jgi:hypothetical protein
MAFKSIKYEFVEIVVPGTSGGQTGTRFGFPDLPKLRYTSLQAVSFYTAGSMITTPQGNPLFSTTTLKSTFLTLYANERQDLYRIPVLEMNRMQNSATDPFSRGLFEFTNQKVTWDKSYVEFFSAPGNTSNTSICFGVFYC